MVFSCKVCVRLLRSGLPVVLSYDSWFFLSRLRSCCTVDFLCLQRKVFVMGTTTNLDILSEMGIVDAFNVTVSCPVVSTEAQVFEVRVFWGNRMVIARSSWVSSLARAAAAVVTAAVCFVAKRSLCPRVSVAPPCAPACVSLRPGAVTHRQRRPVAAAAHGEVRVGPSGHQEAAAGRGDGALVWRAHPRVLQDRVRHVRRAHVPGVRQWRWRWCRSWRWCRWAHEGVVQL